MATVADRVERGKVARAEVPRESHSVWEPPAERADPVELLKEQAKTRVHELVRIRYGRMLVSPFDVLSRGRRGSWPATWRTHPFPGLRVQCCGDAHLSNFGVFRSAERRLIFDIDDFDETLPGPWEWDVKRLAVEHDDRCARQRVFRARCRTWRCSRRSPSTGWRCASSRDAQLDVWSRARDRTAASRACGGSSSRGAVKTDHEGACQGAHARQHGRVRKADSPAVNGHVEIVGSVAADRPARRACPGASSRRALMQELRGLVGVSRERWGMTAACCWISTSCPISPARSSAWGASAHVPGSR